MSLLCFFVTVFVTRFKRVCLQATLRENG